MFLDSKPMGSSASSTTRLFNLRPFLCVSTQRGSEGQVITETRCAEPASSFPLPPELEAPAAALEHGRRKRHALIYDRAGIVMQADVERVRDAIDTLRPWVFEQAEAFLAKVKAP